MVNNYHLLVIVVGSGSVVIEYEPVDVSNDQQRDLNDTKDYTKDVTSISLQNSYGTMGN